MCTIIGFLIALAYVFFSFPIIWLLRGRDAACEETVLFTTLMIAIVTSFYRVFFLGKKEHDMIPTSKPA